MEKRDLFVPLGYMCLALIFVGYQATVNGYANPDEQQISFLNDEMKRISTNMNQYGHWKNKLLIKTNGYSIYYEFFPIKGTSSEYLQMIDENLTAGRWKRVYVSDGNQEYTSKYCNGDLSAIVRNRSEKNVLDLKLAFKRKRSDKGDCEFQELSDHKN